DPPAPIRNAPADLQRVVAKCLAKDRDDRYHSIRDAALDLREWLRKQHDTGPIGGFIASPFRAQISIKKWITIAAIVVAIPFLAIVFFRDRAKQRASTVATATPPEQRSVRRVTSSGRASQVAISPDGRYLAYVTTEPKGAAVTLEQIETRSTLQIVAPMDAIYVALTFSRDGNYLYFARYDSGPIGNLYRVAILGGKPEKILADIDTRVTFSPAGDEFAFVRDDYNKATSMLVVASADGITERVLATFRISNKIWSPTWSPDGKSIVVAQRGRLISVAYPTGTIGRAAAQFSFDEVGNAIWTSSGTLIVTASTPDSDSRFRLWEIDPETSEGHPLTDALTEVVAPAISNDGKSIAALQVVRRANLFAVEGGDHARQLTSSGGAVNGMDTIAWLGDRVFYSSAADGAPDLWSLDVRTGEATRLTRERSWEIFPTASPDGQWIYFRVSTSTTESTIWRMRPDGSEKRRVTDGPRDSGFAISPDSKTIAWSSLDPKTNEWVLWSQPVDGGERKRLASRANVLEYVRFARDGKSIVFVGYADSHLRLYRIAAEGGAVETMTDKAATEPDITADGNTLACAYDYGNDAMNAPLGIINIADGKVTTMKTSGMRYRWRPHENQVTFVREDASTTQNIWLQAVRGGEPRQLTNFEEGAIAGYAWSPDGKRLVGTHVVDSKDVVMIRR
ncbi:MAG TPA: hypothetical protein VMU84_05595, partial [Thermoanaerobaculia bacterium]|nr:hypothetical protein [Thermoanaerobaculia bacterium]